MTTSVLERLEADIERLSLTDQLWLMERLAQRIRERARPTPIVHEHDLIAMASDPAIQQELRQIDAEFAVTEADGLDRAP
jgi:hypothetical protein